MQSGHGHVDRRHPRWVGGWDSMCQSEPKNVTLQQRMNAMALQSPPMRHVICRSGHAATLSSRGEGNLHADIHIGIAGTWIMWLIKTSFELTSCRCHCHGPVDVRARRSPCSGAAVHPLAALRCAAGLESGQETSNCCVPWHLRYVFFIKWLPLFMLSLVGNQWAVLIAFTPSICIYYFKIDYTLGPASNINGMLCDDSYCKFE